MERSSDTKERLVDTAAKLMHARGFNDVGVQEICATAGVQKGSFYHFFKSKGDLAAAALDKHWSEARNQYWRLAFGEDVAPLNRIRRFFQMAYDYIRDESEGAGSTKGAITCGQLEKLKMPLPPNSELAEITEHLDVETESLTRLEADAERAVELLQERRTALISAAVTGKIDVRGFAPKETA